MFLHLRYTDLATMNNACRARGSMPVSACACESNVPLPSLYSILYVLSNIFGHMYVKVCAFGCKTWQYSRWLLEQVEGSQQNLIE